MRIAVIDNYDSFTYNLVHLVKSLGVEVDVFRNDQFQLPAWNFTISCSLVLAQVFPVRRVCC